MWLGVVGIVYGAFMTFAQTDIKRLVAYSSVSHMGFVLIGIYAGTELALQGAVITMLAHGISAGALFILCGEVYERLHTRDLRKMGGLWSTFPYLPPIALFFRCAALGLPGLGNFVGEFLVLLGTFKVDLGVTLVAATGLILAAVYSLIMMQRAFHGPVEVRGASSKTSTGASSSGAGLDGDPAVARPVPAAGARHLGRGDAGTGACSTRRPEARHELHAWLNGWRCCRSW